MTTKPAIVRREHTDSLIFDHRRRRHTHRQNARAATSMHYGAAIAMAGLCDGDLRHPRDAHARQTGSATVDVADMKRERAAVR
jgi:hypothetical protein